MPVVIKDVDHGFRKLMGSLGLLKRVAITVGVHSEDGGESDGIATVIDVATWNEFGTESIPPRPAITGWAEERVQSVIDRARGILQKAIKTGSSPLAALDRLAQVCAGEIQAKIAGGVPPPNAPSTIAKKGSSTPLINTGQFRSSIRGKLDRGGK